MLMFCSDSGRSIIEQYDLIEGDIYTQASIRC